MKIVKKDVLLYLREFIQYFSFEEIQMILNDTIAIQDKGEDNYVKENKDLVFYLRNKITLEINKFLVDDLNLEFDINFTWKKNGVLHHELDKPACYDYDYSFIRYFKNGLLHNENGPAIIDNDYKEYWEKGEFIKSEEID